MSSHATGHDGVSPPGPAAFDAYTSGYFERNDSGLKGEVSFLVLTSEAAFDAVFGFGATMGRQPDTLPPDAFDASIVVAVIHRGDAIWTYQVDEVASHDQGLRVSYRAHKGPSSSARFASPLIVRLPKQGTANVQLIENGEPVATLDPDPPSHGSTAHSARI